MGGGGAGGGSGGGLGGGGGGTGGGTSGGRVGGATGARSGSDVPLELYGRGWMDAAEIDTVANIKSTGRLK